MGNKAEVRDHARRILARAMADRRNEILADGQRYVGTELNDQYAADLEGELFKQMDRIFKMWNWR